MSERDQKLLLEDMLESAVKIRRYTAGLTYDTFIMDEKTVDAVVRNFEIIGEAANRLDQTYRAQHPEFKWNRLRGFRNRLIHEYFGIDYEIVWDIIENNIQQVAEQLEKLLSQEP